MKQNVESLFEEFLKSARKIINDSENEAHAAAKINEIKGVKIRGLRLNGATGSSTFLLFITLAGLQKNASITHRFPILQKAG